MVKSYIHPTEGVRFFFFFNPEGNGKPSAISNLWFKYGIGCPRSSMHSFYINGFHSGLLRYDLHMQNLLFLVYSYKRIDEHVQSCTSTTFKLQNNYISHINSLVTICGQPFPVTQPLATTGPFLSLQLSHFGITTMENSLAFLLKLNIHLLCDSAVSLLSIHPQEIKIYVNIKICM